MKKYSEFCSNTHTSTKSLLLCVERLVAMFPEAERDWLIDLAAQLTKPKASESTERAYDAFCFAAMWGEWFSSDLGGDGAEVNPTHPTVQCLFKLHQELIEEEAATATPQKIELVAGKYYRTRGGDLIGPLRRSGDPGFPFECCGITWKSDGFFWDVENDCDLVSEVLIK